MAEIFMEKFGEKLVADKTNLGLLKVNGLDRLPSPQNLQGKIILKGTETSSIPKKSPLAVRIKKCMAVAIGVDFSLLQKVVNETINLQEIRKRTFKRFWHELIVIP